MLDYKLLLDHLTKIMKDKEMTISVNVYDTVDGDVRISDYFINKLEDVLLDEVKKNKKGVSFNNAIDKVVALLKYAKTKQRYITNVDCHIDQVDIDEDELELDTSNYEEGYYAREVKYKKDTEDFKFKHSDIITKLENKVYHFGKHQQDELSDRDCRILLDYIEKGE